MPWSWCGAISPGNAMSDSNRVRAFLAVPASDAWIASAHELLGGLKPSLPDASWTRPASWHLTLVFLGEIPADVIVSATGFNMSVLGDVAFSVDGEPVDFSRRVTWRGIMINGLPNMAYVFGYFRHSWTLRVDLVCDLVGRLMTGMRDKGATMVVPTLRPEDADMQLRPWSDPENFNAGYVMRSQHILFKQGDHEPWTHMLEHEEERQLLPEADLDDGTLAYS